jgi:mono/diheme cytochrome c family protein
VHVRPAIEMRAAGSLERGRYLYRNLMDCDGCHQTKGAPIAREKGIPGSVVAPNITPDPATGLGAWTDGEKIRAIREGIRKDGRPLFPVMPYMSYKYLSDADAESLVTYLNSLPPQPNRLPRSEVNFVARLYVRSWPGPPSKAQLSKGEYLVKLANCVYCHTPLRRGRPVASRLFSGGRVFAGGVISRNITPDPDSGIGSWSEQNFIDFFRSQPPDARSTPMPWAVFRGLTAEDLSAIYQYLRTQRPVSTPPRWYQGLRAAVN